MNSDARRLFAVSAIALAAGWHGWLQYPDRHWAATHDGSSAEYYHATTAIALRCCPVSAGVDGAL